MKVTLKPVGFVQHGQHFLNGECGVTVAYEDAGQCISVGKATLGVEDASAKILECVREVLLKIENGGK
jgi:hypothetical protein